MKKVKYLIFAVFLCLLCVMTSCGDNEADVEGEGIVVELYDGETLVKTVNVQKDEEYDFGTLSKTGYTFLGWYSEAEGGTAYTDAEGKSAGLLWSKTEKTTAYASWEVKEYKILFDYCEATADNVITDIQVKYDSEIPDPLPIPKKDGFTFAGWYSDKTNGKQVTDAYGKFVDGATVYNESFYTVSDEGTTLYAHWTSKKVTYMFSTDDGTPVAEVSYPVGTVLEELPVSFKENYCFVSWCFDSTKLEPMSFPYTIPNTSAEYVTLYANFLEGTVNVLEFNTISSSGDREYEVSYSGNDTRIVIPDSYYGKKVTRVRKISSPELKEIILPQTVNEFINGAFSNCSSLEKINIPLTVEKIPEKCFSGCKALNTVDIPRGVEFIGKEAFEGCASITQIQLSKNLTTINTGAFRNMKSLAGFTVDAENERYFAKDGVLYNKVGMSYYLVQYPAAKSGETYNIDELTVKIMDYAFSESNISSIVIGQKINSIENGAFENCNNLVNVSIIGNSVSLSIDELAFSNCVNLKAIKIESNNVPLLNKAAFDGVSEAFAIYVNSSMVRSYQAATGWRDISDKIHSLGAIYGDFAVEEVDDGYTVIQYFGTAKEVVIPEILNAKKIVMISENAFAFSKIEKVTVPKTVVEIKNNAFKSCTSLKSVVMECEPPILGDNAFASVNEGLNIYIKNTVEVLDAYRAADKWSELSDRIWSYQ